MKPNILIKDVTGFHQLINGREFGPLRRRPEGVVGKVFDYMIRRNLSFFCDDYGMVKKIPNSKLSYEKQTNNMKGTIAFLLFNQVITENEVKDCSESLASHKYIGILPHTCITFTWVEYEDFYLNIINGRMIEDLLGTCSHAYFPEINYDDTINKRVKQKLPSIWLKAFARGINNWFLQDIYYVLTHFTMETVKRELDPKYKMLSMKTIEAFKRIMPLSSINAETISKVDVRKISISEKSRADIEDIKSKLGALVIYLTCFINKKLINLNVTKDVSWLTQWAVDMMDDMESMILLRRFSKGFFAGIDPDADD